MAYNILEGGNLQEGDRTEVLLELIRRMNPDVLGLCECRGFRNDDSARFQFFARALGMAGYLNEAPSGNHVALLWKDSVSPQIQDGWSILSYNGCARVVFPSASLGTISVIMTHLHPYSSLTRRTEIQTILGKSRSSDEALVMGDFNCLDPGAVSDLSPSAPLHVRTRLLDDQGAPDTGPIDLLLQAGFVQVRNTPGRWTYPTPLGGKQVRYGCRVALDHAFATPKLALTSTEVQLELDATALAASDHVPIVVDFTI